MAKTKLRTNYQDGEELLAYDVNLITETINTLNDNDDSHTQKIDNISNEIGNINSDIEGINNTIVELDQEKQNILTAGSNITITNNTISSNQIDDTQNSSTRTWSSSKIASEIADASFEVQIVQSLPKSGGNHTIYFVPSSDTGETNYYDEFMWVDNAWEKIGSTEIDLSNYYTRDETATTADIEALFAR